MRFILFNVIWYFGSHVMYLMANINSNLYGLKAIFNKKRKKMKKMWSQSCAQRASFSIGMLPSWIFNVRVYSCGQLNHFKLIKIICRWTKFSWPDLVIGLTLLWIWCSCSWHQYLQISRSLHLVYLTRNNFIDESIQTFRSWMKKKWSMFSKRRKKTPEKNGCSMKSLKKRKKKKLNSYNVMESIEIGINDSCTCFLFFSS